MMSDAAFNKLIDEIMTHGYDEKTASHFAALIGDTPAMDEHGNVVVMENGRELARFKLKFVGE